MYVRYKLQRLLVKVFSKIYFFSRGCQQQGSKVKSVVNFGLLMGFIGKKNRLLTSHAL